ncbi:hypothetical protein [Lentzea sp. NPDC060358]|uniref:hypothetical protein n=1 Tax=Lentzea sp. NPDC060358 TaxID=3347103 RepID=UPI00365357BC
MISCDAGKVSRITGLAGHRTEFDRGGSTVAVTPTLESVAPQRIRPQHRRAPAD